MSRSRLAVRRLEDRLTPAIATWDGGGANNLWTTAANWVGNIAPNPGDDLVFPGGGQFSNLANDFAPGTGFRSIMLGNDFQLGGNAVTISSGMSVTAHASPYISLGLVLSGDQSFSQGDDSFGFYIAGSIDLNGHVLTLSKGTSSPGGPLIPPPPENFTVTGTIHGAGRLIKDGVGNVVLRGDNTYSGVTEIRLGVLYFSSDNAAGAAGSGNGTLVDPNGSLNVSDQFGSILPITMPEPITFAPIAEFNPYQLRSYAEIFLEGLKPNTFTGLITLTGASRWEADDMILTAGLAGTGSLSVTSGGLKFGAGSVNAFTGQLVNNPVAVFNGTGPFKSLSLYSQAGDGATVSGTGTIGPLSTAGVFRILPGDSSFVRGDSTIGTLTTGNLNSQGALEIQLDATGADKVAVHGLVTLGGTLTMQPAAGLTIPTNAVYRIIDNDGADFVGGAFSNALQGAIVATINGVPLYINYRGGDGNDVELTTTQPPPLPGPRPFFAVAAGAGGGPQVKVYDEGGALVRTFLAYDSNFTGGVHVAVADVNGDGIRDVITAPGQGGGPVVRVWDGATGQMVTQYNAYDPSFRGGVFVAASRIDNNAIADIVTGAGAGGGPHVKVFSGASNTVLAQWMAYDLSFFGGVSVGATDGFTIGGTFTEGTVITGAGPGGGPHVRTFNGLSAGPLTSFFAYETGFTGGVYVAGGNFNGNGQSQIVTAPGVGGSPQVKVFNLQTSQLLNTFNAYDANFHGGVFVAVTDADSTGQAQLVTGAGPGGGPHVKTWRVTPGGIAPPTTLTSFLAFDPSFLGGVFVG